ncbi:MAG: LamB/YcsF family protein [Candidatus Eremiobacteraeota bacterium]|nr:LamB/YcsF family protein [Candidatus Eremiobacteraeota bacterium]MBV8365617.1 LamB/YcsF family protein [Candidatus Eremiobacteraeota bacterium]
MAKTIDLNCDIGESYGAWRMGDDAALLDIVSSANIACGFHAGDPATIDATVAAAVTRGVAIGAHPSYPDLAGFGRRSMDISARDIESAVLYQIAALAGFATANGGALHHVKPHGALYNDAGKNAPLAAAIARAVRRFDARLILVGLPESALIEAGKAEGLTTAGEGFCDRAYEPDGSLRARTQRGAVFDDPKQAAAQAVMLAHSDRVRTICIHGDTSNAPEMAQTVRNALLDAGYSIAPPELL